MSNERGEAIRAKVAKDLAERLRSLGWFDTLLRMESENTDAFRAIDDARLLEMALGLNRVGRRSGTNGTT